MQAFLPSPLLIKIVHVSQALPPRPSVTAESQLSSLFLLPGAPFPEGLRVQLGLGPGEQMPLPTPGRAEAQPLRDGRDAAGSSGSRVGAAGWRTEKSCKPGDEVRVGRPRRAQRNPTQAAGSPGREQAGRGGPLCRVVDGGPPGRVDTGVQDAGWVHEARLWGCGAILGSWGYGHSGCTGRRLSWGSPGLVGGQDPALRAPPPWGAGPALCQPDPAWPSAAGRPEWPRLVGLGSAGVPAPGFRASWAR